MAMSTGENLLHIPSEINGECRYELADGERIGLCFPVHGWQPPGIVRQFIRKAHFANADGHYCFAVCTCGDEVGDAIGILNHDLSQRGLHIDSAFSITMPNTYVCLPFMDTDPQDIATSKIIKAKSRIKRVALAVNNHERETFSLTKGALPFLLSHIIGQFFNRNLITDKHFSADTNLCTRCGRCANVCPVGNIHGGAGLTPTWKRDGKCTCCLACYHRCPTHAIGYAHMTKGKGQYYYGKNATI